MLDSQFEILQGMLHALDRKLDESLGKLAVRDGVRFAERRLLSVKGHLRGGPESDGQRESAGGHGR